MMMTMMMTAPALATAAPRFQARTGRIDGFDAAELVDSRGARALVARRGATLLDWRVANAFKRPELNEAIRLAALASRSVACGAEFDPCPTSYLQPYAVHTA